MTHVRALIWKLSFGRFFRLDFCVLRPKPSPRGEGGPAQPGRMRGRPGTQRSRRKPAYRRQAVGHGLSTRKGWVQNRPLISLLRRQLPPKKGWVQNRPLISLLRRQLPPKGKPQSVAGQPPLSRLYETPAPARPAGGRAPSHGGHRAAGQSIHKNHNPQGLSHQSGESRGEKLSLLVFFPPFLTGEMEAAGRHSPGALRPEVGKSLDHP